MIFVFDCRSDCDEDFDLELNCVSYYIFTNLKYFHVYIDTLVSTCLYVKILMGNDYSSSFNI